MPLIVVTPVGNNDPGASTPPTFVRFPVDVVTWSSPPVQLNRAGLLLVSSSPTLRIPPLRLTIVLVVFQIFNRPLMNIAPLRMSSRPVPPGRNPVPPILLRPASTIPSPSSEKWPLAVVNGAIRRFV